MNKKFFFFSGILVLGFKFDTLLLHTHTCKKKKKKASRVNVIWLANRIAGVMKQVDKAMAKDEAERLKRIFNKELGAIHEDIK